jgi:SAM-dependent methyltransferase
MGTRTDNWDQHWQEFGAAAELGPTPKYRRRLIWKLLGIGGRGESVRMLEVGSGTGEFAAEFCARYPLSKFLGVELSQTGVEVASRRASSAEFRQRDLLLPGGRTDVIDFGATHALCSEVLEHLDEPVTLLRNACAYMQPGCKLIVTVPGGPMNTFYRHIGHRRHYSPAELKQLLERAAFRVERVYGAGFPFFNLFRVYLTMRGDKLIDSITGPPSPLVRLGMALLDFLFRFNLMRWGWQTVAVARWVTD